MANLIDCRLGESCPVCGTPDEYIEVDTPEFCDNYAFIRAIELSNEPLEPVLTSFGRSEPVASKATIEPEGGTRVCA